MLAWKRLPTYAVPWVVSPEGEKRVFNHAIVKAVSVPNLTLTVGADGGARPFRLAAVLERSGQYFDASSQTCRRHLRATIEKLPE